MTILGFHASHEQIPPDRLLRDVQAAERAGFDAAMCSDHFAPWLPWQGESGFAWSWLGAALATTRLPFGVVTAPGQRYHPAVIAQAIATLASMFPGRFWAALGSGEALNEHITGTEWPVKADRDRRLDAVADTIARLLDGEEVTRFDDVRVHRARLWSRPAEAPRLYAAAVSAATAGRVASWADGLITVGQPLDALRRVVAAYRENGGRGQCLVQVHVSWAPTEDEAFRLAEHEWRNAAVPAPLAWEIDDPEAFAVESAGATEERIREGVLIGTDPGRLAERIRELIDAGFDGAYLHHVGPDQTPFLREAPALVEALRSAS